MLFSYDCANTIACSHTILLVLLGLPWVIWRHETNHMTSWGDVMWDDTAFFFSQKNPQDALKMSVYNCLIISRKIFFSFKNILHCVWQTALLPAIVKQCRVDLFPVSAHFYHCLVADNDQIRQERLRKGGRPQSAHSLSQRNSRASCSSAQVRQHGRVTDVFIIASYDANESYSVGMALPDKKTWRSQPFKGFSAKLTFFCHSDLFNYVQYLIKYMFAFLE